MMASEVFMSEGDEPSSYHEAINCKERNFWIKAMHQFFKGKQHMNTNTTSR